jgi:type II secretory pathway pseudopilin PulG
MKMIHQKVLTIRPRPVQVGFTLIEVMVSISVLMILVIVLTSIIDLVGKSWVEGEKKMESSQSGRAILDLISRDLAAAVVGSSYQFVQNPTLPSGLSPAQAKETDSLFFQSATDTTTRGNFAVLGYYVVRDENTKTYQLRRLRIAPDHKDYPKTFGPTDNVRTSEEDAAWVRNMKVDLYDVSGSDALGSVSTCSIVADGVVGFWIRCLDAAGQPIPWWYNSVAKKGSARMKFNSAAKFVTGYPISDPTKAFAYLSSSVTYPAQADELPSFIEITLILVDALSIKRTSEIPNPPRVDDPATLPAKIIEYQKTLLSSGIKSARSYSTRIKTRNAIL